MDAFRRLVAIRAGDVLVVCCLPWGEPALTESSLSDWHLGEPGEG